MSAAESIRKRIEEMEPGSAMTPRDFHDVATDGTARKSLERLCQTGLIGKALPGIYYKPYWSKFLKRHVKAGTEAIAHAIARDRGWTIATDESLAMNSLGLDTQVPGMTCYGSTGPYATYIYDGQPIKFFGHRAYLAAKSPNTKVILQALRGMGKTRTTDRTLRTIARNTTAEQLSTAYKETHKDGLTPWWMSEAIARAYSMQQQEQTEGATC